MKQYDLLPTAAHFGEPLLFACFDLMNWKDYGIIKRYENERDMILQEAFYERLSAVYEKTIEPY